MLSFQSPIWLLLFLPMPAALFLYFVTFRRLGGVPFAYRLWSAWGFYPRQPYIQLLVLVSRLAVCAALVCLVFSLARPNLSRQEEVYFSTGAAIFFVLDLSPSMAAIDQPPYSRLEHAKQVIQEFIQGRANDSVGLVGFGSEAALLWPPTQNHRSVMQRLDELRLMSLGQGTAIGLGIAMAAVHLDKLPNKKKIVVMLTDGSNNTGEIQPEGAASMLRERSIDFYAIGLGAEGTRTAQVFDPETGLLLQGVLSESYNPQRLREIAQLAGGTFFSGDNRDLLRRNISAIDNAEKLQRNVGIRVVQRPLENIFLKAAFFLLLIAFTIRYLLLKELI